MNSQSKSIPGTRVTLVESSTEMSAVGQSVVLLCAGVEERCRHHPFPQFIEVAETKWLFVNAEN